MDGQNGGQMGKSLLDQRKRNKKNKVAEMPLRNGGAESEAGERESELSRASELKRGAPGADSKKNAEEEKPKKGSKKASEKVEDEEERKGAKKTLRKAVKKVVKDSSTTIAESLVKHAESGDIRSAELVLSLMQKEKDNGDDEDDGPNLAELLANEPPWDGTMEAKRKAREKEVLEGTSQEEIEAGSG